MLIYITSMCRANSTSSHLFRTNVKHSDLVGPTSHPCVFPFIPLSEIVGSHKLLPAWAQLGASCTLTSGSSMYWQINRRLICRQATLMENQRVVRLEIIAWYGFYLGVCAPFSCGTHNNTVHPELDHSSPSAPTIMRKGDLKNAQIA